jgi:hypothetical protein
MSVQVAPGVCSEWHRLSHLRGACFTVGLADTIRIIANGAAQAKAAWSEAAASLDDLLLENENNNTYDNEDINQEVKLNSPPFSTPLVLHIRLVDFFFEFE